MLLSKRRVVFAAASLVVLIALLAMTVGDILTLGESLLLFAQWIIIGVVLALRAGLQVLRSEVERRTKRLMEDLEGRLRRHDSLTQVEFDATRQLLKGAHEQTAARLARLEVALDDGLGDTRKSIDDTRKSIEERGSISESLLQATIGLLPVMGSQPLPPMRAWAGFPDFQSFLYRLVRASRPSLVVECGSGISTVVVATALIANEHGSLVSLDHDEWYASRTRGWLAARGLSERAEVLTAPLTHYEHTPDIPWYGHPWLEADPRGIDLLIVDGPPGSTAEQARYPAVLLLEGRLRDDCVIVLDDVNRDDERATLEAWDDLLPTHQVMILPHVKGTGILFPIAGSSVAPWID